MKISSFLSFSDSKKRTNCSQYIGFSHKTVHVRIILKNQYIYGLFSKIGTYTDYSQKSVHVQIILENLYGIIYKCLLGSLHM